MHPAIQQLGATMQSLTRVLATALCLLLAMSCVRGEEAQNDQKKTISTSTIADLSIEQLLDIKITSASKKVEKASDTPSAVYVITQEDIRRSGATSIPEALRLAPGLNVAQVSSSSWAISSRGFQGTLANKLLVLIDGRSVYTPLYSGVYWGVQDTVLEDIDRIEVIRGPGATVWGANAVNGVINIITKSSEDTHGGLVSGSAGTSETTIDSVRYGGKIGENASYRFFLKYQKRQELSLAATDTAAHDGGPCPRRHAFRFSSDQGRQNRFRGRVLPGHP